MQIVWLQVFEKSKKSTIPPSSMTSHHQSQPSFITLSPSLLKHSQTIIIWNHYSSVCVNDDQLYIVMWFAINMCMFMIDASWIISSGNINSRLFLYRSYQIVKK